MSTNGNKAAAEARLADLSLDEVDKKSFGTNQGSSTMLAQHYNHVHFWKWMKNGRRRQQAAGQAAGCDRQRSRRL